MIGPWTEETPGKWFRRDDDGRPVASIVIGGAGEAFGTVRATARMFTRGYPNFASTQAWCDAVLDGKLDEHTAGGKSLPVAPLPPATPPPPPTVAPPPPAAKPAGPPVERLLRILHNDPDLAWEVAVRAKALGPWVRVGTDWWQRSDVSGFNVGVVRKDTDGTWRWSLFVPGSRVEDEVDTRSGLSSEQVALDAMDIRLRAEGWLLAGGDPSVEGR